MVICCTSNQTFRSRLTVGKKYKVLKETPSTFFITDDKGYVNWFGKNRFYVVDEEDVYV